MRGCLMVGSSHHLPASAAGRRCQSPRDMNLRDWHQPSADRQVVGSFAEVQGVEDGAVGGLVAAFEIFEEAAAPADHLQEALAGIEIPPVRLEVRRELVDALGQQDDLHLGRPGVLLMKPELLEDGLRLRGRTQRGRHGRVRSFFFSEVGVSYAPVWGSSSGVPKTNGDDADFEQIAQIEHVAFL